MILFFKLPNIIKRLRKWIHIVTLLPFYKLVLWRSSWRMLIHMLPIFSFTSSSMCLLVSIWDAKRNYIHTFNWKKPIIQKIVISTTVIIPINLCLRLGGICPLVGPRPILFLWTLFMFILLMRTIRIDSWSFNRFILQSERSDNQQLTEDQQGHCICCCCHFKNIWGGAINSLPLFYIVLVPDSCFRTN